MVEATPPIVIDDDGDIGVYSTVAEACLDLEATDVIDGVYEAFDAEGRRLRLVANGKFVAIEVPQDSRPETVELATRLRLYIQRVGVAHVGIEGVDDASLPEILRAVVRFQHDGRRTVRTRSFAGWLASIIHRRSSGPMLK